MTKSPLTDQSKISLQRSDRRGTKIDTFLIHHQAGTSDDTTIELMVSARKQVSANYTISNEGRITCVVPEEYRAWTSGSTVDNGAGAAWDRRAITVEIENQTAAPDWKISDKALDAAARLLHDLKNRYDIEHVLGHRDLWNKYHASYSTYCPGPNTVASIVKREAALKDGAPAKPATNVKDTLREASKPLQQYAAKHGYTGPVDGKVGVNTWKGVQRGLAADYGYKGVIDGKPGVQTYSALQRMAAKYGGYEGPIDGKMGPKSWNGVYKALT